MLPNKIPVKREEDYHTDHIGKYGDGLQYIGFVFFGGTSQTRPLAVLHLLDENGEHVESKIWEAEKINEVERELIAAIKKLPNSEPGDVITTTFEVELNGLTFGFIPRSDGACIEYLPYGLAFFPPWDGYYDT